MNKVLLLLDDYSELMFIQILLKKLGFDVDALQNSRSLRDRLLGFHPNLLILNEEGRKFDSAKVIAMVQSQRTDLKVIFLTSQSKGPKLLGADVQRISSPVKPTQLIEAVAQSCQVDVSTLLEKFQKFRGQLPGVEDSTTTLERNSNEDDEIYLERSPEEDESIHVGSSSAGREEDYKAYLNSQKNDVKETFEPSKVQQILRAEKKLISSAPKVDRDRKNFVKTLFKKGS